VLLCRHRNTLSLLSDAKYFDESSAKNAEIRNFLEGKDNKDKLEAMKRLLALMSMGRDVSSFFPAVVKNVISEHAEVKKLVYMYITHYAESNQDLALLSINTFQRDLRSPSARIRANAMRAMASINVPVVAPLIVLALQSCVKDASSYVRRAAATAVPKIHATDEAQHDVCVECIEELLTTFDAGVLGATLYAFDTVCPARYDLLHPHFQKTCHLLADLDEWGQAVAIKVLTRYCRLYFAAPPGYTVPGTSAAAVAAADGAATSTAGFDAASVAAGAATPASVATAGGTALSVPAMRQGSGGGRSYLSKYAVSGGGSFYGDGDNGDGGDDDDDDDALALASQRRKKDKKDKKSSSSSKKSAKKAPSFYDDDTDSDSDVAPAPKSSKGKGSKASSGGGKTASLLPLDLLGEAAAAAPAASTQQQTAPVNLLEMLSAPNQDIFNSFPTAAPVAAAPAAAAAAASPAATAAAAVVKDAPEDDSEPESSSATAAAAPATTGAGAWPSIGGSPASDMVPVSLAAAAAAKPAAANPAAAPVKPAGPPAPISQDLAWFLTAAGKLLRSDNVSVVIAVASAFQELAPRAMMRDAIRALIRAARAPRHLAYVIYAALATLVPQYPSLFRPFVREFYLTATDARPIAVLKLDCLAQLARFDAPGSLMAELIAYLRHSDKALVCHVARTVARVGTAVPALAGLSLRALMALVTSSSPAVVADAVVAVRHLVQRYRDDVPVGVIKALARLLPTMTNPLGRCAIVWIVGEHRQRVPDVAPDALRVLTKAFINDHTTVKMQTLNLAVKLYLSTPAVAAPYFKYLMDLCRVDESSDIRERARLYRVLFFKKKSAAGGLDDTQEAKDVFKQCILAPRPVPDLESPFAVRVGYPLDSLSHLLAVPAPGFVAHSSFQAVSSDPSLRKPYEPSKPPARVAMPSAGAAAPSAAAAGAAGSGAAGAKSAAGRAGAGAGGFYDEDTSGSDSSSSSSGSSSSEDSGTESDDDENDDESSSESESSDSEAERRRRKAAAKAKAAKAAAKAAAAKPAAPAFAAAPAGGPAAAWDMSGFFN
jgi:hypothetical protein